MAIIFAENFEHGNAPAIYLWDTLMGAPAASATAKNGSYSMRVGRNGQNQDYVQVDDAIISSPLYTVRTWIATRFWFRVDTLPSGANTENVMNIDTDGIPSRVNQIVINSAGSIYLGTGIEYGSFTMTVGRWEEVELSYGIGGVNVEMYLYVNGTLIASYAASKNTATRVAHIIIGNTNAASGKFNYDAYYDDVILATSRLGTGYTLETEVPDLDDATDDTWTDSGAGANTCDDVDEIPLSTADYAQSARPTAATLRQLWRFNVTSATGTPVAVDSLIAAQRGTLGTVATPKHRISAPAGTAINTDIATIITTTNRYFRTCRSLDCDGAAWTKATADALRVGGEATVDANAYNMRINQCCKTIVFKDTPKDWGGIV